MPLKFYNTLSRQKEDFSPIDKDEVRMYSCGPTVNNYAHLGNLRAYVFADILQKTLEYFGYKVKRVMNITDIGILSSDADTGEIIELNDSGFILQEKMGGGTSSVIISEITKFPDGKSFVSGSRVVVFGDATSTALNERIIHALGVGKPPEFERMPFMISPGGDDMRPHPMQGR
jgi:hypothetical protein